MDGMQTEQVLQLLQTASDRQKKASGETAAFNLLAAIHKEYSETQTHSQIIFFLLNDKGYSNEQDTFLHLFLQTLKIPQTYLTEQWNVYREKAFGDGRSRIDFVIESRSFCAIIEMKINAGDGDGQLNRYASYGEMKRKKYRVYYLTLDGHKPEEQSAGDVDKNKLKCISFDKDIISWLQNCMCTVKRGGYKYSFLKQYLGTVKHITGTNDEVVSVTDLLNSSEMARAAQVVINSFNEKMNAVTEQFFEKMGSIIKRKANVDVVSYSDAIDIFLETFTHQKHTYHVILCPSVFKEEELIIMFGFSEETEEGYFPYMCLEEAEAAFPSIYKKWINKLESLKNLPRMNQSSRTRWFYAEDAQGARLNFKNYSAQIKLIDEMNFQCNFICDNLIDHVINPLLS